MGLGNTYLCQQIFFNKFMIGLSYDCWMQLFLVIFSKSRWSTRLQNANDIFSMFSEKVTKYKTPAAICALLHNRRLIDSSPIHYSVRFRIARWKRFFCLEMSLMITLWAQMLANIFSLRPLHSFYICHNFFSNLINSQYVYLIPSPKIRLP